MSDKNRKIKRLDYPTSLKLIKKHQQDARTFIESLNIGTPVLVLLYGSQNYNLDHEDSDFDFQVVVMPTKRNLIMGKRISKTYQRPHGQLVVKDILSFAETIDKGNHSFIEAIESPHWTGSKEIIKLFRDAPVNLNAVQGTMLQKEKELRKKWDQKNYRHYLRLNDLRKELIAGNNVSYLRYSNEEASRMLEPKEPTELGFEWVEYNFEPSNYKEKVVEFLMSYFDLKEKEIVWS